MEIKEIVEAYGERVTSYRLYLGEDFTQEDMKTSRYEFEQKCDKLARKLGHKGIKKDDYFKFHNWNGKKCIIVRCIDKIGSKTNNKTNTEDALAVYDKIRGIKM